MKKFYLQPEVEELVMDEMLMLEESTAEQTDGGGIESGDPDEILSRMAGDNETLKEILNFGLFN